jgi:mono/diheme cytochrome c family protein
MMFTAPARKAFWILLAASVILAGCGGGGGSSSSSVASPVDTQQTTEPVITWYNTAEPLIQRYCVVCHTEGSPLAPFPLDTYEQNHAKRSALAYVLEAGTMPPAGYVGLTLEEKEKALLLEWVEDGAPQGNASETERVTSSFTYHRDTRAIIEQKCVNCHVDGGVAPFSLDTYDAVKIAAGAALFSVENGRMPPWPPTEGYSRFAHSRALSPEDKFALTDWLDGGLPEGNPADYVAPPSVPVPEIDFNLTFKLPEPYTPTLRPDDHRCFAMDWPLDELAYVTASTVIPDQVAEVHHVIINIVEPEDVGPYLVAGGEGGNPGWPCLLSGGLPGSPLPRQIGGWVPGAGVGPLPEGTGLPIRPGSLLVVQMHYNTLVAEPTPDQSTIKIATTAQVERPASGFLFTNPAWLEPGVMHIPAGDPDVYHGWEVNTSFLSLLFGGPAGVKAGEPWAMHTGFLHMHNLATSGRVTLLRRDGTEQVIIDIRDWDFNWQSTYRLAQEVLVKPGDQVRLECTWDNSASNQVIVNNVQQPPRDVSWGDGTGDEMCLTNFFMTVPKEGYDYSYGPSLHVESPAYRQRFTAGELVPLKLLLNNFSLHEPGAHGDGSHDDAHDDVHHGDHGNVFEGHYHVYLNTDDDAADHLTAWDANYYFQLPDDLPAGTHTLRVSLRGTDHHPLGIEQSVEILVEDSPAIEAVSLIDVNEWAMQSAADDSFAGHRPAQVNCPDNSWYNEDGALEVETGKCNYLSLVQPSQAAVAKGDTLHMVLWHGALAFEEPAEAHAAITVDGHTVWQDNVRIPTGADIYDLRLSADFDAPAGSKVEFHLHNHGYNTWTLLQLEVER